LGLEEKRAIVRVFIGIRAIGEFKEPELDEPELDEIRAIGIVARGERGECS